MKKTILCCLMTAFSVLSVFAQDDDDEPAKPPTTNAQNVFGEIGGNGLAFTVNYDFRFAQRQRGLGMRIGAGFLGGSGGGILTIPFAINNLSGRAPNYFEAGLGATYASVGSGDDIFGAESSTVFIIPGIGYRYQPKAKGFTGRISFSPIIHPGSGEWFTWGGISAGYKF